MMRKRGDLLSPSPASPPAAARHPLSTGKRERKRVCVARIGAAHGTRGEVKLWSFTADPAAVAGYGPLETEDGRVFGIEALRSGKGFLVARLTGTADRSAAQQLRNVELFVPRDRLPEPEAADEFYHADLVGLSAVDVGGRPLGTVVAVQNFGAGDLLEIQPAKSKGSVMLPFTETAVPKIDIVGGRIVVDPPTGIFSAAEVRSRTPPPLRARSTAKRSGRE